MAFFISRATKQGGFDIVIGNPPYISVRTKSFDSKLKPQYKTYYSLAVGQYDLYTLFIEQGYRVLSEKGVLSFIVPTRMLSNENFMATRIFVMDHMPITHYVNAEKPFDSANVEANIMVCQKGVQRPKVTSFILDNNTKFFKHVANIDFIAISQMPFSIFPFVFTQEKLNVLFHIQSNNNIKKLAEYIDITRGFECGYKDASIGCGNYPFLMSEDVLNYAINDSSQMFCNPDFSNVSKYKTRETFFRTPKLLTKFCSNEIKFALDNVGYCNTNSVYNCSLKEFDKQNLYYLLGIVNSKLTTFWFNTAFLNVDSIFPHIQKNQLEAIPVIQAEEMIKQDVIALVDKILTTKQSNPQADTSEFERQIDIIVYNLFNLSPEEIDLIEHT